MIKQEREFYSKGIGFSFLIVKNGKAVCTINTLLEILSRINTNVGD